jgi:hypothetical protein
MRIILADEISPTAAACGVDGEQADGTVSAETSAVCSWHTRLLPAASVC